MSRGRQRAWSAARTAARARPSRPGSARSTPRCGASATWTCRPARRPRADRRRRRPLGGPGHRLPRPDGVALVQAGGPPRDARPGVQPPPPATVTPGVVDTQCGAKVASGAVGRGAGALPGGGLRLGRRGRGGGPGPRHRGGPGADRLAARRAVQGQRRPGRDGDGRRHPPDLALDAAGRCRPCPGRGRPRGGVRAHVRRGLRRRNAALLGGCDRTHWWFRSKAALVATTLRRTATPRPGGAGWSTSGAAPAA